MNSSDKGLVTALAVAGTIIVSSRWAQGKSLDAKIGVGGVFATLFLTALNAWQPLLARGLTATILVTTIVVDGPPLFNAVANGGTTQPLGANPDTKLKGPK